MEQNQIIFTTTQWLTIIGLITSVGLNIMLIVFNYGYRKKVKEITDKLNKVDGEIIIAFEKFTQAIKTETAPLIHTIESLKEVMNSLIGDVRVLTGEYKGTVNRLDSRLSTDEDIIDDHDKKLEILKDKHNELEKEFEGLKREHNLIQEQCKLHK